MFSATSSALCGGAHLLPSQSPSLGASSLLASWCAVPAAGYQLNSADDSVACRAGFAKARPGNSPCGRCGTGKYAPRPHATRCASAACLTWTTPSCRSLHTTSIRRTSWMCGISCLHPEDQAPHGKSVCTAVSAGSVSSLMACGYMLPSIQVGNCR